MDWDRGRLTVTSPKTEHHPGKDTRVIPLFPELRPILEEAFDAAPEGAVYAVNERYRRGSQGPNGWRNCNLRTTFEKIIRRAGLTPWPRLFHNLRSSRETELAERFPIQVVTAWPGNTPDIAMRHYLQVTDQHFRQASEPASGGGAKSGAANVTGPVQNPVQQPAAGCCGVSQETTEPLVDSRVLLNRAVRCGTLRESSAEREGFEPSEELIAPHGFSKPAHSTTLPPLQVFAP